MSYHANGQTRLNSQVKKKKDGGKMAKRKLSFTSAKTLVLDFFFPNERLCPHCGNRGQS